MTCADAVKDYTSRTVSHIGECVMSTGFKCQISVSIYVKFRFKAYFKPFKIFLYVSTKDIKYRDVGSLLRFNRGLGILIL